MDIDPHNLGEPVYKRDQVITRDDLLSVLEGFAWQYQQTPLRQRTLRQDFVKAANTVNALINWLDAGKPLTTEKGENA